jgi:hypothetical protein
LAAYRKEVVRKMIDFDEHSKYRDAMNLLCGNLISDKGQYRTVFECRLNHDWVVKVENEMSNGFRSFHNAAELRFWDDNEDYKAVSKWLAPIKFMSPDGWFLIQERCNPLTKSELPKQLPAFITDTKISNFGWYKKRIVCVDYALTIPNPSIRMRNVNWW